jgi:hypothetical protein
MHHEIYSRNATNAEKPFDKLGMVVHTYNLSTQDTEAGGSWIEANLGYLFPSTTSLKKQNKHGRIQHSFVIKKKKKDSANWE